MNTSTDRWVLGHRIHPLETDDSYGLVEIVSPPGIPGPPPHFHETDNEFFFIVKGTLDVMSNGTWQPCPTGTFVDLPPRTTHTFINHTGEDVVWLTGWRPKGFQRFFVDFGIPVAEADAPRRSVDEALIQQVVRNVERYGMYLA